MFQPRSAEFDPRVSSIVDHLRAIEKELGKMGNAAGRRASAGAAAAGNQIADAIGPVLNEIVDRFRRGQRVAIGEASNMRDEAMRSGARAGSDALQRISGQTRQRPLLTIAVAIGVGMLIGAATRKL